MELMNEYLLTWVIDKDVVGRLFYPQLKLIFFVLYDAQVIQDDPSTLEVIHIDIIDTYTYNILFGLSL